MDIYNTVWLSDYESVKSYGSQSGFSSLNHSKIESFVDNIYHSSPKMFADDVFQQSGWCSACSRRTSSAKNYFHRTLSLPEFELNNLKAIDLQDRFSQLQLEQENKELRLLVDQLQNALESIEQSMKIDINNGFNGKPNTYFFQNTINNLKQQQNPAACNSLDSLEGEAYSDGCSSGSKKIKEQSESGYHTYQHDSYGNLRKDSQENKCDDYVRNEDRFSEYSDNDCSESERDFYESRLTKKKKFDAIDDTTCCIIH